MTVDAEKWHGTGNDFVVVDAEQYVPDRAAFASTHCDREEGVAPHGPGAAPADGPETAPADGRAGDESGVAQADGGAGVRPGAASAERSSPDAGADHRPGADGVLFLALEPDYRPPRAVMTLVQPDGSTAPMCGNGARVAAAWAAERTGADRVMLDTQAGTRLAQVERGADESATDGSRVAVEMGHPSFAPGDVPMDREEPLIDEQLAGLPVTAVDTGVPHAVAFVPDVEAVDLDAVAGPIRHHDLFPRGVNVTLASPRDGGFAQRTYERGVEGETRSCGTGAVAIAAAARRLGLADDAVAVSPPGGDLIVRFPEEGPATLTGPVERSFSTELPRPEPVRR